MARKKVPLRYIGNSNRRRTYETRRNNLMKKAGEVGILCNTKACVLVYDEGAVVPDVYPSRAEAVAILNRYKDTPNLAQFKKVVSQEEFLTKRIAKLQHEADKLRREREDREIRTLLHKAMLGGNLNAEEVARVGCKLIGIRKSLGECIAKTRGQPPVFQPQAPSVTGDVDMGPPPMYQVPRPPPQQQQGWQSPVLQPQAPYVTGSVEMGPPQMYQAPPPQQQEGWVDTQRSEGDHGALLYNANSIGGHDGAGTSSSAGFPVDEMMQFFYDMDSGCSEAPFPEASSSSTFAPI